MRSSLSLVFGYFFYRTSGPDVLATATGPGVQWPVIALVLALASWDSRWCHED